ncbi:MAG TPA: DNA polymerase III subunit beta [Acidimicrobiales bacterium]|nr:DNA polymerase III subunit beta [Acidimicrobiales bacterium]
MKFRSERDALVEILATAGRAVGGRGAASAVMSGLLLHCEGNRLVATGTDLDLTIRVDEEVIGLEDGESVVPARLIADVVRSLEPGAVTVEAEDEKVEISAARSRFGLRAYPVVEFPVVTVGEEPTVLLSGSTLGEGLRQVVRAASNDDARPLLTGVLLTSEGGSIRLVATDSYRLALRDLRGSSDLPRGEDILVPARALAELQRLLPAGGGDAGGDGPVDVGVVAGPKEITFAHGSVRISTRLLEGAYPDYRQLVPDHYPNRLHLGKESLLGALRRVRLLVRDNTTPVRLSMRAGGVDLSVVSQEVGDASETVDGDFTGEDLVIAFNPSYLIDGVEAVLGDEVVVETDDPSRPATVRAAEHDDFRYLLMPVRVS